MEIPVHADTPRLVDTSVLSLFLKGDDQLSGERAQLYVPDLLNKTLAVSFITIGELYALTILRKWSSHRITEMEQFLSANMVKLPWHDSVAHHYARIQTSSTPKQINDAWIAACALAYGCVLVADDNDFHGIAGLQIISHANEARRP